MILACRREGAKRRTDEVVAVRSSRSDAGSRNGAQAVPTFNV
jgi:hypothetical protein